MEYQKWLDSLKEGDEVVLKHNVHGSNTYSIQKITRITPKRIIKVGGFEYNSNGGQRGRTQWDTGTDLIPITQKILEHIEKNKLVDEIYKTKFSTLDLEKLRAISEILK